MNSRTREFPILIRWGVALIAVRLGWLFGIASYVVGLAFYLLLVPSGSFFGLGRYGIVSGLFCLAAWIIVGLPLAIWDPKFSSRTRVLTATIMSGGIGLLMMVVVLRPARLTFNVFPLLAFLTAAFSMLTYINLLEPLKARIS